MLINQLKEKEKRSGFGGGEMGQMFSSDFVDNRPESVSQRRLQSVVNASEQVAGFGAMQMKANASEQVSESGELQEGISGSPEMVQRKAAQGEVVQRKVKVGRDRYELGKRGYGQQKLIDLVDANKGDAILVYDWKARLRKMINGRKTERFLKVEDLILHLTKSGKSNSRRKYEDQDERINKMNTGYGKKKRKLGSYLSYESGKALEKVEGQVKKKRRYMETVNDLESLQPGSRSTTNDFTKTDNPYMNLLALKEAKLKRLDFKGKDGLEIDTRGYSSMKDRTVNPNTLNGKFGLGTIKIGPNTGSYKKEMGKREKPDEYEFPTLNALEMGRLPQQSVHTGMKRKLYEKRYFSKDQGMGFNHNHSSVEFLGAVNGGSMRKAEKANMRKQQDNSNLAILDRACKVCPGVKVGEFVREGKLVPTAKNEMEALKKFEKVVNDDESTQEQKNNAKKALRKVLTQMLRAILEVDVESEDETEYPTSPYRSSHYD